MTAQPYYGVPYESHTRHIWSCRDCKNNPRRFARCPAYQRIDADFYRQHIANGGSKERHFSAIAVAPATPTIGQADEGTDLMERS